MTKNGTDSEDVLFAFLLLLTHVYVLPSDDKMHKYMPWAFKRMYSVSCVATFLAKKNSCWLREWPL